MATPAQRRAVATARAWAQGPIRALDDAMTRRLVASTVLTESSGGDLDVINRQGFAGRYQAGAVWLADAGYVDPARLRAAMARDGHVREWSWAVAGGMTRFLREPANWRSGLSLQRYLASADLQDRAFRINSDAAVDAAMRDGAIGPGTAPRRIAGFLKARHLAGLRGGYDALRGVRGPADVNGTTNLTYFDHIVRDTDGLDALMQTAASPDPLGDGALRHGDRGNAVRHLQARLNAHGMRGLDGRPVQQSGNYLDNTRAAVRTFQRLHGLAATGVADRVTLAALEREPGIARGDRGAHVEQVHRLLGRAGYAIGASTLFHEATEAAVGAFQQTHGLAATGVVDPETLRRLDAAASKAAGRRA